MHTLTRTSGINTLPDIVSYYNFIPTDVNNDTALWPDRSVKDVEMTGVSDPVIAADGSRTFDGTNDYFRQKAYDTNQGVMTFVADGDNAEFRDAGQDFSAWETAPANTAKYMLVVTTDNGVSWGYMGASNNAGADIDIYSDIGLTTRAWKGRATPQATPDTAASYEVLKTDFQITGSLSILAWLKPDDGQGAAQAIATKYSGVTNSQFSLDKQTGGQLRFYTPDGVDATDYKTTDAAVFADGAQAAFTHVGVVYTAGVGASVVFYKNGALIASTATNTIQTSLQDSYIPFMIGAYSGAGFRWDGQIASVMVFNRALTAVEVARIYNLHKTYFGL